MQGSRPTYSLGPSTRPLSRRPLIDDDVEDEDDIANQRSTDEGVLSLDPLHDLDSQSHFSRHSNGHAGALSSQYHEFAAPRRRRTTPVMDDHETPTNVHATNGHAGEPAPKPVTMDWTSEGPGRRVGYEDLTAIDWIFEYAKERQRLKMLYLGASGLWGHIQQLADASQIWCVLLLTGLATGLVAACIDVASDWLGDLKYGVCTAGTGGGKFYLNRAFCCWGLDEYAMCADWHSWSDALGIDSTVGGYSIEYLIFLILSVCFAAVASTLVANFSMYARQSGIPEIKTVLGGFVMRQFLDGWTLIVKSLGLCYAVASGLWLGKEGPLVHVACCCSNMALKLFPVLNENEARKREVFSAAASAGISVAFGAPIGGVLFSLEQLSYYFPDKTMWQSFVCAMLAAVTLQLFNPFRTGKLVLYEVTYSSSWHSFEIIPFILLGVMGGLYGAFFIKVNMMIANFRRNSKALQRFPLIEVMATALVTALINYPNLFMRAQSTELVATLFAECEDLYDKHLGLCGQSPMPVVVASLFSASVLGFLLASVTFGLQIPAGIILPSMAIGALYGRGVGSIMRSWHESFPDLFLFDTCEPDIPCVTAGTYAIIGAASALGGATRMTVSIVVIMFELTGALTYVLPFMVSVMIAKWVADAFGKSGVYESWINFQGYPFLDNRDDTPVPDVAVSHLMTRVEDLVVITAQGHTIESLHQLLHNHAFRGFPVISDSRHSILLGYISRTELRFALRAAQSPPKSLPAGAECFFSPQRHIDQNTTVDLRPWMDQTPITLSAQSSLQLATDMFLKLGLRYVLFCDRGALKGLFTKKDVWHLLHGPSGAGANVRRTAGERIGRLRDDGEGEGRGLLGNEYEPDEAREPIRVG